jgi:hypothetical protein
MSARRGALRAAGFSLLSDRIFDSGVNDHDQQCCDAILLASQWLGGVA